MAKNDDRVMEFSELLQKSRSRVFGLIYAVVLNMADAEDLFQQTATLLWEKFDEFESGTDFTAWALRVARFNSANFVRGRYRERRRLATAAIDAIYETSLASADAGDEERLDALKHCLTKLKDADRSLVQRCYGDDQQIADVAAQEGKSAGSLYAALHRIRRALMECVKRTLSSDDRRSPSLS
ncbi:MAG: sigma-70 family RNA polymerase sigma factor [Planctomycetales bacterium]|nr:sigma-70 family RNA polymerase sigma factor [Planctomycetales bacterium]